jgi:hypothetical protein
MAGLIKAQSEKVGFEITIINAVARCWFWTDRNKFLLKKVFFARLVKIKL